MSISDNEQPKGVLEKHLQTGFQVAIIALCGWTVMTTQGLSIETARMGERVVGLQEQVANLQNATANRYTDQDADRDNGLIYEQLKSIRSRLDRLEAQ